MSQKIVNFCYRSVRINRVHVVRSRMQPFWLQRDGSSRCTGYGRDAVAFVETAGDAYRLRAEGYHVIHLDDSNCQNVLDEIHIDMPFIRHPQCI